MESLLKILDQLSKYLLLMGIPGLFAISFIDSAAVPLAGGPDAVLLLLSWQKPGMFFLIALVATAGSTLGCLVLYGIGWKGGEKALSRFSRKKIDWVETRMREYGIWIIIAAVLAPPPFPTKLAILAAGVLRTSRIQLVLGVFAGRLLRYSIVAYLGAEFGDEAAGIIKAYYPELTAVLVVGFVLVVLIRRLRKRRLTRISQKDS
jgi:membrane protein YqaA with SNARE-associated domain